MLDPINLLLLVEDDDNDIIITKRKIARANFTVNQILVSKTLKDAQELLQKEQVDIVLLDLNLPDSLGLNTVDSIRNIFGGAIVVLTSIDDELVGIDAIRRGADEYIVKNNLTERQLRETIYHALERQKRWARIAKINNSLDKLTALSQQ